jgi:phosphosulfolactate synthase
MDIAGLELPDRSFKPRTNGLTIMIDNGMPLRMFKDVIESTASFVDLVKLGWGTAVVTPMLDAKLARLEEAGIGYLFGGTLFEKYVQQDRFESFVRFCRYWRCRHVEVSNGTIAMDNEAKSAYVAKLADEFTVLSEVGRKTDNGDGLMSPERWAECVREDVDAGASLVVLEARESGRAGIADRSGEPKEAVLEAVLSCGVDRDRLVFEAPTKPLQAWLVSHLGANVNLANISPTDLIGLETIRLGLRSDTFDSTSW